MATINYSGVGISAMSACVPKKVFSNRDFGYLIPDEEVEKTRPNIGIEEHRIADDDVLASDFVYKAAVKLMEDHNISPDSIDVLLFESQTSDYRIPAIVPILQHRFGLSKDMASLDITLGCSGYVFAHSTAFAYASMKGVNRVLLLDVERFSKRMEGFNFAKSVVPSTIKEICKETNTELADIDYLVFHQANKFMTSFFNKYLRFDKTKVPYCIQKYGNTSSTSVPLTMVSELEGKLQAGQQLIMVGFGAGLSWGVAKITMGNVKISTVIEY